MKATPRAPTSSVRGPAWAPLALLAILAACGADGGSSGTGISTVAGNVAGVDLAPGEAVDGIVVSVEGTKATDATDSAGRFEIRGGFEGEVTVVFSSSAPSVLGRAVVNVPPQGTLTLEDVRIDSSQETATPAVQRVDCEGVIDAIDCSAQKLLFVSPGDSGDRDQYTVLLDGAFIHDGTGNVIPCDALELGDEIRVRAVVDAAGSFTQADVEVQR